ncbi:hypothetical protein SCHPADRAFT_839595, partial [Schizopora paradoxa]
LHPRVKTNYFENENWERDWIETAKDILTEQWDTYYCNTKVSVTLEEPEEVEDLFAELDEQQMVTKPMEMGAYLREDPIKDDFAKNPIKYWCCKTGDRAARMALDFLSAPGEYSTQSVAVHVASTNY